MKRKRIMIGSLLAVSVLLARTTYLVEALCTEPADNRLWLV